MQSSMEKLKNVASAAKEQVDVYKAKIDEKAGTATARTQEEKAIAHELAKAKEARAKMELHESKAKHAAEKLGSKQSHYYGHDHPLVGTTHTHTQYQQGHSHNPLGAVPMPGATNPTYPLGRNLPGGNKHI